MSLSESINRDLQDIDQKNLKPYRELSWKPRGGSNRRELSKIEEFRLLLNNKRQKDWPQRDRRNWTKESLSKDWSLRRELKSNSKMIKLPNICVSCILKSKLKKLRLENKWEKWLKWRDKDTESKNLKKQDKSNHLLPEWLNKSKFKRQQPQESFSELLKRLSKERLPRKRW